MNLRSMLKKALGRMTKCRFLVVDMFPGKVRRENIWTQIGINACVLLLPPILAIAVFAPHPPRPNDTPGAFESLVQSISLPITEGSGRGGLPNYRATVPLNLRTDS